MVDQSEASEITVTPGTGSRSGKLQLSSGSSAISFEGTNEGFKTSNSSDEKTWLSLVELSSLASEDFVTYSAEKISVSTP